MKLKIAVIFGGRSVEHEISIISALQCIGVIDKNKFDIIPIYISKSGDWYSGEKLLHIENFSDIDTLLFKTPKIFMSPNTSDRNIYKANPGIFGKKIIAACDVIFPILHGTNGEDGEIQGFFETKNIPYVGCDVLSSAITMDKIMSKIFLKKMDIPVLDEVWFYSLKWIEDKDQVLKDIFAKFQYPLIVKPANLGSSVGVSSVANREELEDAIDLAVSMSYRVLVEPKITNLIEVNCAVLGDRDEAYASVCEELLKGDEILSYKDKYMGGGKQVGSGVKGAGASSAKRIVPATISQDMTKKIQDFALRSFQGLNCSGVARVDFLIDKNSDEIYLCELNTIPGSLSFFLWEPLNISFKELVDRLITLALKKHRQKNNLIVSYDTNILQNFSYGAKGGKIGGCKVCS